MSEEKFERNKPRVNIGILRSIYSDRANFILKSYRTMFPKKFKLASHKGTGVFSRRNFLFGFSMLALAACAEPVGLFGERATESFAVQSIKVDMSGFTQGIDGRENSITNAQVKRDVHRALSFAFENRKSGTRKVRVVVKPSKLHLSSRLAAAVSTVPSHMIADVNIVDAKTGKLVVAPISYRGTSEYDVSQPVSLFSSLTKLSVTKDYLDTVYSFAEQLNVSLFGATDAKKSKLKELTLAN